MAAAARDAGPDVCPLRRVILLSLGSAGLATLAGCGGSADKRGALAAGSAEPIASGGTSARPGASSGPAGTASTPAPDESYAPWPKLGGDTQGGLVSIAEVPIGGGVLAGDYLVVQPQRGAFKAFNAKCPHQGVTVDPPLNGADYMNCPGHNSRFRVADGSRISGPAPRGLRQVAVGVKGGYVVLA
jgi:nitrite reductase/ring-hydroxylating ferredoxin subunit